MIITYQNIYIIRNISKKKEIIKVYYWIKPLSKRDYMEKLYQR